MVAAVSPNCPKPIMTEVDQPRKLFLGGLNNHTTTEKVWAHFGQYGRVTDAVAVQNRGFGFVTFETAEEARKARSQTQKLDGHVLEVKEAVPRELLHELATFDHQPKDGKVMNKVFVGGLAQETTKEDLQEMFKKYGTLSDVVVILDTFTRESRRFGFVRFASGEEGALAAQAVVRDNGKHQFRDGTGFKIAEVKIAEKKSGEGDTPASTPASSPTAQRQPKQWQNRKQQQQQPLPQQAQFQKPLQTPQQEQQLQHHFLQQQQQQMHQRMRAQHLLAQQQAQQHMRLQAARQREHMLRSQAAFGFMGAASDPAAAAYGFGAYAQQWDHAAASPYRGMSPCTPWSFGNTGSEFEAWETAHWGNIGSPVVSGGSPACGSAASTTGSENEEQWQLAGNAAAVTPKRGGDVLKELGLTPGLTPPPGLAPQETPMKSSAALTPRKDRSSVDDHMLSKLASPIKIQPLFSCTH